MSVTSFGSSGVHGTVYALMKPTMLHPVLFHWMSKGAMWIGRLAKIFLFETTPVV